jgi:AcrR family transcriptional regulator
MRLKQTQRERLIDAMIELCAQGGYHKVSITELCSFAGVSPVTFNEQFQSKEDCLVAAHRHCCERIFGRMWALAGESGEWPEAARRAMAVVLEGVQGDPDAGHLLFIEALGGGPLTRAERQRVLREFERGAEQLLERTPTDRQTVDVPPIAVIGALRHVVSRHLLTHSADRLPSLLEDGMAWLSSYAAAGGSERWRSSAPAFMNDALEPPPPVAWAPEPLPRGTHGLSASVIARSQRTRLIYATAEVMLAKGYANARVSDIAATARVARTVFHEQFADKEDAFLGAQEHPTHYILDRCAQAYFSTHEWPERVWRCLTTLVALIASYPATSHLCLVECYVAGPAAIRYAEENASSFTFFLEEGYRYRKEAEKPHLFSQAIAGAIFEIIRHHVEQGRFATLTSCLPQLAYVAIAPFAGAEEAIRLVEEFKAQLAGTASADHPRARGGPASGGGLPGGRLVQEIGTRAAGWA